MKKLIWKDEYSVGVELFDHQHQRLFDLINKLAEQSGDPPNIQLATQTLKEMLNYAKEHFTDEEKLMEQCQYPELPEQKNQHTYFLKTTAELCAYSPHDKEMSVNEIAEFLNIWWLMHILKLDMKYKEFFQKKLVSSIR